jgi:tetratricopeptide (TPR) repeat protein
MVVAVVQANKHTARALQLEKTLRGETHPTVAQLLRRLADIHLHTKQEARALELCNQAADINLRIFGHDHPKHAEDQYTIGIISFRLRLLESSLEHLRTALAVYLKVLDTEDEKEIKETREAIEMVEHELAKTRMSPEEYEAWKRRMAEERLRRLETQQQQVEPVADEATDNTEPDDQEEREPIIRSSGRVGSSSVNVFDDDFYEL